MNLLRSARGRRLLFALLYFTEGAPIGFLWWTLPVLLRRKGLDPETIGGWMGLLVLPWAFKWLWAPAIDLLRGPRLGLRGWIASAQLGMVLCLAPLLFIPLDSPAVLPLLLAHAFCAATQDVAIDALAMETVPHGERGRLNGAMQAGMLIGRGLFGGVLIGAREAWGEGGMVLALLLAIALVLPVHLLYHGPQRVPEAGRLGLLLRRSLSSRRVWILLGFAASGGVAFEMVGSMAGSWLVDLGTSDADIARFFALPAILGMGLGALLGGYLADRTSPRRACILAGVGTALLALTLVGAGTPQVAQVLLAGVYLGAGALTASSYALFMDATDPDLAGTQFSTFMGATNLCESWAARLGGTLAGRSGYPFAFQIAAGLGAVSLLWLVPKPGKR